MTALIAFLSSTTTWTRALTLVTVGFGIQQLTVGHNIDPQTALTILLAGLAGGGVSVAHAAGVSAASSTNGTTPTPPPASG